MWTLGGIRDCRRRSFCHGDTPWKGQRLRGLTFIGCDASGSVPNGFRCWSWTQLTGLDGWGAGAIDGATYLVDLPGRQVSSAEPLRPFQAPRWDVRKHSSSSSLSGPHDDNGTVRKRRYAEEPHDLRRIFSLFDGSRLSVGTSADLRSLHCWFDSTETATFDDIFFFSHHGSPSADDPRVGPVHGPKRRNARQVDPFRTRRGGLPLTRLTTQILIILCLRAVQFNLELTEGRLGPGQKLRRARGSSYE